MQTVLVSSISQATGNAVTVHRLAQTLGHAASRPCRVVSCADKQVNFSTAALLVALNAWRCRRIVLECPEAVPIVVILGGTDVNVASADPLRSETVQRVLNKASRIVSFTAEMRSRVGQLWPALVAKVVVIEQAVDIAPDLALACAYSFRSSLGFRSDDIVLLLIAGLRPVKDILFLVDAIAIWHKTNPRVHLAIVGPELDATYASHVRQEIARYPTCVHMIGTLPRPHVLAAIREASFVVNTSLSEGMSNALLEAFLVGATPVLARDNPGNQSLCQPIDSLPLALLFSTPTECIEQAQSLLLNPHQSKEMVARALHLAQQKHSCERELDRYTHLLSHMSKDHPHPHVIQSANKKCPEYM